MFDLIKKQTKYKKIYRISFLIYSLINIQRNDEFKIILLLINNFEISFLFRINNLPN